MTIKKVITGDEARLGLLKGMEIVAKTVGATAGAAGRNVAISNQWGQPSLTKDGYKTSKSISLAGIEEEGVKLIKKNSRNYAKRQVTYIKHQFPVNFYKNTQDLLEILKK